MLYFVTFSKHVKLSLFNFFELLFSKTFQVSLTLTLKGKVLTNSLRTLSSKILLLETKPIENFFLRSEIIVQFVFLKTLFKSHPNFTFNSFFFFWSIWLIALNHFFFPEIYSFIFPTLFSDAFDGWKTCNMSLFAVWAFRKHIYARVEAR